MNKNSITIGFLGLAIGLFLGFFGANYLNRNSTGLQPKPQSQAINRPLETSSTKQEGSPIADVQKVLDKAQDEPKNAQAQMDAGEMYLKIERFEKAIEYYQKAQNLKPDDLNTNVNLGNVYFDAKKYEKAEVYYEKALEINPKSAGIRTDYGLTFYLREPNDVKRAIKEYKKALLDEPKHEIALQNLAAALKEAGETEELAETLKRLKEINPNNSAISGSNETKPK